MMHRGDGIDQTFFAGIFPIKDSCADWASLLDETPGGPSSGFNAGRLCEIAYQTGDARHYGRDYEYGNLKVSKFLNDQITYRDFRDKEKAIGASTATESAGGTSPDEGAAPGVDKGNVGGGLSHAETDADIARKAGYLPGYHGPEPGSAEWFQQGGTSPPAAGPEGSVGQGRKIGPPDSRSGTGGVGVSGGPQQIAGTRRQTGSNPAGSRPGPDEAGFEMGLLADGVQRMKTYPYIGPYSYHGKNRSTLVHAMDELEEADKGRELARHYFGRLHSLTITRPTQNVAKTREQLTDKGGESGGFGFVGGGLDTGVVEGPVSGGGKGSSHFSSKMKPRQYQEGFWAPMINVTAYDNPYKPDKQLNRLVEEEGGPGIDGMKAHHYSTAVGESTGMPGEMQGRHYQGGWLYDSFLYAASMLHDIIGVGKGEPYYRYTAMKNMEISTTYIRHDALFARMPSLVGRILFRATNIANEWAQDQGLWCDLHLDPNMAGYDTMLTLHETGEWRVIIPNEGKRSKSGETRGRGQSYPASFNNEGTKPAPPKEVAATFDGVITGSGKTHRRYEADQWNAVNFSFLMPTVLATGTTTYQLVLHIPSHIDIQLQHEHDAQEMTLEIQYEIGPDQKNEYCPQETGGNVEFTCRMDTAPFSELDHADADVMLQLGFDLQTVVELAGFTMEDMKGAAVHIRLSRVGDGSADTFVGGYEAQSCGEHLEFKPNGGGSEMEVEGLAKSMEPDPT